MTDNTEAMELWREVHGAFGYHGHQAAAIIIAAKLAELRARIEGLEGENFMLAAGACINPGNHGLVGDERGNSICTAHEALKAEGAAHSMALARIAALRNRLIHISDNSEDGSSRLEADIALDDDDESARQALEADHGA